MSLSTVNAFPPSPSSQGTAASNDSPILGGHNSLLNTDGTSTRPTTAGSINSTSGFAVPDLMTPTPNSNVNFSNQNLQNQSPNSINSNSSGSTPTGGAPSSTTNASTGGSTGPARRKPARRANTAERRATHNAVERQRRETLNGRFLDLAALLPNLANVRRPSKSAIVNSSIALVHTQRRLRAIAGRELRALVAEADALRREVNEWRLAHPNHPVPAAKAPSSPSSNGNNGNITMEPIPEPMRSADFVAILEAEEMNEDEMAMTESERIAYEMRGGDSGPLGASLADDDDDFGAYGGGLNGEEEYFGAGAAALAMGAGVPSSAGPVRTPGGTTRSRAQSVSVSAPGAGAVPSSRARTNTLSSAAKPQLQIPTQGPASFAQPQSQAQVQVQSQGQLQQPQPQGPSVASLAQLQQQLQMSQMAQMSAMGMHPHQHAMHQQQQQQQQHPSSFGMGGMGMNGMNMGMGFNGFNGMNAMNGMNMATMNAAASLMPSYPGQHQNSFAHQANQQGPQFPSQSQSQAQHSQFAHQHQQHQFIPPTFDAIAAVAAAGMPHSHQSVTPPLSANPADEAAAAAQKLAAWNNAAHLFNSFHNSQANNSGIQTPPSSSGGTNSPFGAGLTAHQHQQYFQRIGRPGSDDGLGGGADHMMDGSGSSDAASIASGNGNGTPNLTLSLAGLGQPSSLPSSLASPLHSLSISPAHHGHAGADGFSYGSAPSGGAVWGKGSPLAGGMDVSSNGSQSPEQAQVQAGAGGGNGGFHPYAVMSMFM